MKSFYNRVILASMFFACLSFSIVQAQTVRYTTETRTRLPGLGALANVMGSKKAQVSTVYVTPSAMRSEDGDGVTIVDLNGERILTLDTKKKTYYEMTFEEMMAFLDQASADLEEEMEEARETGENPGQLEFDLSVEDLGETQEVAGYPAHRKLMRMVFKYTGEVENEEGEMQTMSGQMYALSDMWVAKGVEGEEVMKQFAERYGEKLGISLSGQNRFSGVMQVFQQNGQMGEAFEKMREEVEKIDGTALRTTMYMVMVPEGQELDVDAVLRGAPAEEEGGRRRGRLGRLARGALQGRGINIGRGGGEEEDMQQGQRVMLTAETRYTEIATIPDDPSLFAVPAGYERIETPDYYGRTNR